MTMVVADGISPDVDEMLCSALQRLPLPAAIGAPMLFGKSRFILVRSMVASTKLLELHAEVMRICVPYLRPAAAPNTEWGNGLRMSRWRVGSSRRSSRGH